MSNQYSMQPVFRILAFIFPRYPNIFSCSLKSANIPAPKMKLKFYAPILLLAVMLCGTLAAQPKKKMSVKDYYWLLPNDAFDIDLSTNDKRELFLTVGKSPTPESIDQVDKVIDDPKNGFLEVQFTDGMGPAKITFAVWRTKSGADIVGVNHHFGDSSVPKFYQFTGGNWREVTSEIFSDFKKTAFKPTAKWPAACGIEGGGEAETYEFPAQIQCDLPRKGLDITCKFAFRCETRGALSLSDLETKFKATNYYKKPKVKFVWRKDKFIAR
jgi:hypothetical protein